MCAQGVSWDAEQLQEKYVFPISEAAPEPGCASGEIAYSFVHCVYVAGTEHLVRKPVLNSAVALAVSPRFMVIRMSILLRSRPCAVVSVALSKMARQFHEMMRGRSKSFPPRLLSSGGLSCQ